jgi:hypothetical protein
MLQEVAHHLQKHAKVCPEAERDAFARSAYNRYYYAGYLKLRAAFTEMDESWARTAHKSYPDTLRGDITRRLKRAYGRADKIGDNETTKKITAAQRAIPALCRLIEAAYSVRVVADYNPDVRVVFGDANSFSLNSIDVSTAFKWQSDIETLSGVIIDAWKHIDE